MDVDAVAFDIDGTLYPNRQMYFNSVLFFLGRLRFLKHYRNVRKSIRNMRPIDNFRLTQADLLSKHMKITPESARLKIDKAIYQKWQKTFKSVRIFPHLYEALKTLHRARYKLGVMSDFPADGKLQYLRLPDVWDCIISSEDTGYLKPNPEPFLAVASCFDTTLERILYVGNNYEYDIVGAHRVGMKTAHLAREPVDGSVADLTFTDYRELESVLIGVAKA